MCSLRNCSISLNPGFLCRLEPLWTLIQEDVDALINCVMKDAGFSQGKPVAAFTIYKCLLHWKSFEAERTSVFDRLIQMIGSAIEVMKYSIPMDGENNA